MKIKLFYFILFNVVSLLVWGGYFLSYIVLFFFLSMVIFFSLKDGKKMLPKFFFLIMIVCLIYSFYSLFVNYPGRIFNNGVSRSGYYEVVKHKFETRRVGTYTSRDGYVEPSSFQDLFLKSGNDVVRVSCSINESGCPFYKEYNKIFYVEYFSNYNLNKNFITYIKGERGIYNFDYFRKKYFYHFYLKIFFIFSYIFLVIVFVFFILKGKIVFK